MTEHTKVVVVRHGETYSNASGGVYTDGNGAILDQSFSTPPEGRNKVDLNQRGMLQAQHLAERLKKDFEFDAVICSSIERAVETLAPFLPTLNERGTPVKYTPELRERESGHGAKNIDSSQPDWISNVEVEFRRELLAWLEQDPINHTPQNYQFIGGEDELTFHTRVTRELAAALEEFVGKTILFLAHGWTNQLIIRHLNPEAVNQRGYGAGNTAVSLLEVPIDNGPAKIVYLGDDSHLPPELKLTMKSWKPT